MSAKPSFTNSLIHERSPYLLQHAHNPVQWMPWSSKIMELATAQNKPILLSIGYAACHWCHVMERESFEDEQVANFMNAHFINVKVDREERPDIDQVYMDALQAMTGAGGWPLNIFLLPNAKPFYGGTYFPPQSLPQRASWMEVLKGVKEAYDQNKEQLIQQADQLTAHIVQTNIQKKSVAGSAQIEYPQLEEFDIMVQRILQQADHQWGGFGTAPKFPQTFAIQLLFRNYYTHQDQAALEHALKSLDGMIKGGIYDHVGGGFSRYSTDTHWQAPHFEKMLYDNALFITVLSEAYQITQNQVYQNVLIETIEFVERELKDADGGYYAALDADSEGVEGKFYTWEYDEIKQLLPSEIWNDFCTYFQIQKSGNWEGTNILWTREALEKGWSEAMLQAKSVLFQQVSKRIKPSLDYKIILSWNALMITALCKAAGALEHKEYQQKAIDAMSWLEQNLYDATLKIWYHANIQGHHSTPAFLEDYANLIQAYIQLNQLTGEKRYALKAKEWMYFVQTHFLDEAHLFFYFTPKNQQDIVVRKKENYDGATPSSNAMMCSNLLHLAHLFDEPLWKQQAIDMLVVMHKNIIQYPLSFAYWGQSFYQLSAGLSDLVAIGPNVNDQLPKLNKRFLPLILALFLDKSYPEFSTSLGKQSNDNQYFICKKETCSAPFTTIESILAII